LARLNNSNPGDEQSWAMVSKNDGATDGYLVVGAICGT